MNFEKYSCHGCSEQFKSTDDVVVCPVCGTPQHRECWKKEKKCVNDALHDEGYVWVSPENADDSSEEKTEMPDNDELGIICPNCGTNCPANSLVCPNCATSFGVGGSAFSGTIPNVDIDGDYFMNNVSADPSESIDGVSVRDAAAYIQVRNRIYIPKYIRMSKDNRRIGWNWAAFFFSPLWFFYRKIYKAGALFAGLSLIAFLFVAVPADTAYIEMYDTMTQYIEVTEETTYEDLIGKFEALSESEKTDIVLKTQNYMKYILLFVAACAVVNIFAALYADYFYRTKVVKEVSSMRKFAKNEKTFLMLAVKRGGVSFLSAASFYLAYSVFIEFASYLANY